MNLSALNKLSPSITTMIRMDHTHVMTTFHRYRDETSPSRKKAIAETVCLALEIHAQLEEEVFYPALRTAPREADAAASQASPARTDAEFAEVLAKSEPEHNEMRRLIGELRAMQPTDAAYDDTFMALMREVMHHVADEETTLLPYAERVLKDELHALGAQMTKRRLQLVAPKAGTIAVNTARAMPAATVLAAAGTLLAGGYLLKRAMGQRHA